MKKARPLFWVFTILVVIAAALAVVFVVIFGEKSTQSFASNINSYTTSGYLSNETNSEYQKIMTYLNKLDTTLESDADKAELENFKDGYTAYLNVANFFEREAAFMNVSRTYRKNKKQIQGKLAAAQKNAEKFVEQIVKNEKITEGSEYWQRLAWMDCKDLMKNVLTNTIDAYNLFAEVYKASVKSNLLNNDYSDIMFEALKNLSAVVKEEYRNQVGCGAQLKTFTSNYFTKSGEAQILKYAYTDNNSGSTFRTTVLDIKAKGKGSACYEDFISNLLTAGEV